MAKIGKPAQLVPRERIENKILLLRGQRVILDSDLAELYQVPTKALNQAVRRNLERFPADFMFQVSQEEAQVLRSQTVTSNNGRGGRRYLPYAFTEHGVAMLSSVLNSEQAIRVNIAIMRAFVRLRQILATHQELAVKFEELERQVAKNAADIKVVSQIIRQLLEAPPGPPRKPIGFQTAKG